MTQQYNTHSAEAWTEVEYSDLCKSPYLSTPVFVPKEAKCYLCRQDGTREEQRMIFLVFKPTSAPFEAEWEDDPTPGELWVRPLGEDDEYIEPAKVIYLGQDIDDLVRMEHEDDQTITFDIHWRHGSVKVEKTEETDEGYVCLKDNFADDGLALTLLPDDGGHPVVLRLSIPYLGFSLYNRKGQKIPGQGNKEIHLHHSDLRKFTYEFVGDENNDRFSLQLDDNKLNYLCVLRPETRQLVVRDQRDHLAEVGVIPCEGKLLSLMMGAQSALIKNKNKRWRLVINSYNPSDHPAIEPDPKMLVNLVKEQMSKEQDIDELGQHLMGMERQFSFLWFWLKEDDWSHDDPMFDMFMRQLCSVSYLTPKGIQADQLAVRNNKRKINRCVRLLQAHRKGELSLWEEPEEQRQEFCEIFFHYHQAFMDEMEGEE